MFLEKLLTCYCLRITVGREANVDDPGDATFYWCSKLSEYLKIYFVLIFINYSYTQEIWYQRGGYYISERRCPKCSRKQGSGIQISYWYTNCKAPLENHGTSEGVHMWLFKWK